MAFWNKLFHRYPAEDAPALVSQTIIAILQEHRLLGEILLQLPRQFADHQGAVVGLHWVGDQLTLVINPNMFNRLRHDDAQLLLAHEALHVLWQHPLRYAGHPHPALVNVATDMAVNQYLPAPPPGTATLEQVQKLLRRRIPARLDSQDYLRILAKTSVAERERLKKGGIRLEGDRRGQRRLPERRMITGAGTSDQRSWPAVSRSGSRTCVGFFDMLGIKRRNTIGACCRERSGRRFLLSNLREASIGARSLLARSVRLPGARRNHTPGLTAASPCAWTYQVRLPT